jgi:hypothetical protein
MSTDPNQLVIANLEMGEWGLTKREYFAALAMQSVLSTHGEDYPELIAGRALKYADALINALNKPTDHAKP